MTLTDIGIATVAFLSVSFLVAVLVVTFDDLVKDWRNLK